jgi:trimethyllysine dioxygenase
LQEYGSLIRSVEKGEQGVTVEFLNGAAAHYDFFWLRDHATDAVSYDSRSHQRALNTAKIEPGISPAEVNVAEGGEAILVLWPDVDEPVLYSADFLEKYRKPARRGSLVSGAASPWEAGTIPKPEGISFLEAESGPVSRLILPVLESGFVLVRGCPPEAESVRRVAARLGGMRSTIFGDLWTFSADENMADSAYTPKELRPHTDSTYSHDAPGLQMLLCCEYDAQGGQSILVDGFAIFEALGSQAPELLNILKTVEVPGQYIGDGHHLMASRPVFRCHPRTGELLQVSFNNYDRAPFRLPDDEMRLFYDALRAFEEIANAPENQWRHNLKPGELLIFDNWRVLHGRGAFSGQRSMAGCYVNREDFESCIRLARSSDE